MVGRQMGGWIEVEVVEVERLEERACAYVCPWSLEMQCRMTAKNIH